MDRDGPAAPESLRFGALLKRYRVGAGLSQEALVERARLWTAAISAYERGERQAPYQETVALLVLALGLSPVESAVLEATVPRRRGPRAQPAGVPQPASSAVAPMRQVVPGGDAFAPPFVGRAREVALLERHLAGEGPPLLLLAGEPGIGKSRLLREAAHRPRATGWQVLAGWLPAARRPGPVRAAAGGAQAPPPHPAAGRQLRPICAAAPGWCACCPNWRRARSSRCPPGRCRRSRSGG